MWAQGIHSGCSWETLGFTELVLDIWVVAGTLLAQTSQKRPALSIRAVHPVQLPVINLAASMGPHKGGCGVLIAGMIKCFPVSNIAVICCKQAFELYTN